MEEICKVRDLNDANCMASLVRFAYNDIALGIINSNLNCNVLHLHTYVIPIGFAE